MTYDSIGFSKNLLKGRIAETLFEQMLRDAGCFTILSFGYEKVIPELAHCQNDIHAEETMEIIRRAPDYAVINNETHEVYLIEVKYLMYPTKEWILHDAQRIYESWKPSYLFIATPDGFYLDKARTIINNAGTISPLNHPNIPKTLQDRYTKLLNEFIIQSKQSLENLGETINK